MKLAELAARLAGREVPDGVQVLKQGRLRTVVRRGDGVLKVLHVRPHKARREAATLVRARQLGIPVPELVDRGEGWIATRFVEGRPARREDLDRILPAIRSLHAAGMLHRDLHLGNILMQGTRAVFLDTQKAWFLPQLPRVLIHWELGFFAHSLGEPLPEALRPVAAWRERRAQRHWRSRTARCQVESSGFTRFELAGQRGQRVRDADPAALERALAAAAERDAETLKDSPRSRLHRHAGWIVKRHRSPHEARAAWIGGWGLEVRGIGVARPLAWVGPWIVMEDAGPTLSDWVDAHLGSAAATPHLAPPLADELVDATGGLLARLHRARIYHADLKANNICWQPGRVPRLIDYGRVRFGRRISRRRRIKNLAQLNAALPDAFPGPLRERALATYARHGAWTGPLEPLRRAVIRLSLRRGHRWSGC